VVKCHRARWWWKDLLPHRNKGHRIFVTKLLRNRYEIVTKSLRNRYGMVTKPRTPRVRVVQSCLHTSPANSRLWPFGGFMTHKKTTKKNKLLKIVLEPVPTATPLCSTAAVPLRPIARNLHDRRRAATTADVCRPSCQETVMILLQFLRRDIWQSPSAPT
jgi:hypothetical protein